MKTCIKPENRSWGARPPRALLDAPRIQPFGVRNLPACSQLSSASEVFREGAENCARGGRAPQVDFGCRVKNLFLLPALIASVGLILAGHVTAQTFTTLHSFTGGDDG